MLGIEIIRQLELRTDHRLAQTTASSSTATTKGEMDPDTTPNSPSARRGGNYTIAEDVAIARAYVNVSMDPITGSDQKEGTYYSRIYDVYKQKKPEDCVTRPMTSVTTRVKTMTKEVVRFAACYKSVVSMRKRGYNEDDNVRLATAMFFLEIVIVSDYDVMNALVDLT